MSRNAYLNRRLRIERLERRQLLCSSMMAGAGASAAAQSALFARSNVGANITSKSTTKDDSGSSDEANETHLFATLTDTKGTVVGTAFYETEAHGTNTTQEMVMNVAGAAANASYAVTAGTTSLGTLTTDANGNGHLHLTSSASTGSSSSTIVKSHESGGTLPAGFTLAAGATIGLASTDTTIDPLSGTFATASGDLGGGEGHGDHGCHNGEHGNVTRLVAALTNAGAAAGKAKFITFTADDGTMTQILRVHVKGADASATLDVSIDGTSVGSITTDANGNGVLILSSHPKNSNVGQLPAGLNVTSTSTIAVGTSITGTFDSSTSKGGSSSSAAFGFGRFASRRR